jgi:hypothetical protein
LIVQYRQMARRETQTCNATDNSELRLPTTKPNATSHDVEREHDAGNRETHDVDVACSDYLHEPRIGRAVTRLYVDFRQWNGPTLRS